MLLTREIWAEAHLTIPSACKHIYPLNIRALKNFFNQKTSSEDFSTAQDIWMPRWALFRGIAACVLTAVPRKLSADWKIAKSCLESLGQGFLLWTPDWTMPSPFETCMSLEFDQSRNSRTTEWRIWGTKKGTIQHRLEGGGEAKIHMHTYIP